MDTDFDRELNKLCTALCCGSALYLGWHLVRWYQAGFAVLG